LNRPHPPRTHPSLPPSDPDHTAPPHTPPVPPGSATGKRDATQQNKRPGWPLTALPACLPAPAPIREGEGGGVVSVVVVVDSSVPPRAKPFSRVHTTGRGGTRLEKPDPARRVSSTCYFDSPLPLLFSSFLLTNQIRLGCSLSLALPLSLGLSLSLAACLPPPRRVWAFGGGGARSVGLTRRARGGRGGESRQPRLSSRIAPS
jgi:hypothetical protein